MICMKIISLLINLDLFTILFANTAPQVLIFFIPLGHHLIIMDCLSDMLMVSIILDG